MGKQTGRIHHTLSNMSMHIRTNFFITVLHIVMIHQSTHKEKLLYFDTSMCMYSYG